MSSPTDSTITKSFAGYGFGRFWRVWYVNDFSAEWWLCYAYLTVDLFVSCKLVWRWFSQSGVGFLVAKCLRLFFVSLPKLQVLID